MATPSRSFSVTLQPRRLGFARDLTLEDVHRVFSELKQRRPEIKMTLVHMNAEGLPPIDSETEFERLASSPADRERKVSYASVTHPSIGGGSRIEFSGGQIAGQLRVRDQPIIVGGAAEIGLGILGFLAMVISYLNHLLIGTVILPLVVLFLLMILDGYRRIGNGKKARIEFFRITTTEPGVTDAVRREVQGISL